MIGRKAVVGFLFFLSVPMVQAGSRWSVGVSFGAPYHHHHRPCYGPPPCVYRPYVPIYVRPAPIYVQPVTVLEPVPATYVAPAAPAATVAPVQPSVVARAAPGSREEDIARYQQQLQSAEARDRVEAVMQLGRLRAPGCERPLVAALNNDRSPQVREAAAKALGLFGATESLDALQRAAQADEDGAVRNSAAYSADVIRASYQRR